ncbi:MAG: homocysteine S-methyltransferase, partial [Marmoricola sp.]|nr:homocysteine S-methyltransferase [Marmoricola sp.]
AWLSFSVEGDRTRAGQPLATAYAVAAGRTALVAAGVNCSAPGDVRGALEAAAAVTGLPGVAYPNRGEAWDDGRRTWTGDGAFDPALAPTWVVAGARLVGGCCRVGPADIGQVAAALGRGRTV